MSQDLPVTDDPRGLDLVSQTAFATRPGPDKLLPYAPRKMDSLSMADVVQTFDDDAIAAYARYLRKEHGAKARAMGIAELGHPGELSLFALVEDIARFRTLLRSNTHQASLLEAFRIKKEWRLTDTWEADFEYVWKVALLLEPPSTEIQTAAFSRDTEEVCRVAHVPALRCTLPRFRAPYVAAALAICRAHRIQAISFQVDPHAISEAIDHWVASGRVYRCCGEKIVPTIPLCRQPAPLWSALERLDGASAEERKRELRELFPALSKALSSWQWVDENVESTLADSHALRRHLALAEKDYVVDRRWSVRVEPMTRYDREWNAYFCGFCLAAEAMDARIYLSARYDAVLEQRRCIDQAHTNAAQFNHVVAPDRVRCLVTMSCSQDSSLHSDVLARIVTIAEQARLRRMVVRNESGEGIETYDRMLAAGFLPMSYRDGTATFWFWVPESTVERAPSHARAWVRRVRGVDDMDVSVPLDAPPVVEPNEDIAQLFLAGMPAPDNTPTWLVGKRREYRALVTLFSDQVAVPARYIEQTRVQLRQTSLRAWLAQKPARSDRPGVMIDPMHLTAAELKNTVSKFAHSLLDDGFHADGFVFTLHVQGDSYVPEIVRQHPALHVPCTNWAYVASKAGFIPSWWTLLLLRKEVRLAVTLAGEGFPVFVTGDDEVTWTGSRGTEAFGTYSAAVDTLSQTTLRSIAFDVPGSGLRVEYFAPVSILELGNDDTPTERMTDDQRQQLVSRLSSPFYSTRKSTDDKVVGGRDVLWVSFDRMLLPFKIMRDMRRTAAELGRVTSLDLQPATWTEPTSYDYCIRLVIRNDTEAELGFLNADGGCRRFGATGTGLLNVAIALATKLGYDSLLLDDASTVPCGKHERLRLGLMSVFKTGKTWYGRSGFIASEDTVATEKAMQFLHTGSINPALRRLLPVARTYATAVEFTPFVQSLLARSKPGLDPRASADFDELRLVCQNVTDPRKISAQLWHDIRRLVKWDMTIGQTLTVVREHDCALYLSLVEHLSLIWPEFKSAVNLVQRTASWARPLRVHAEDAQEEAQETVPGLQDSRAWSGDDDADDEDDSLPAEAETAEPLSPSFFGTLADTENAVWNVPQLVADASFPLTLTDDDDFPARPESPSF